MQVSGISIKQAAHAVKTFMVYQLQSWKFLVLVGISRELSLEAPQPSFQGGWSTAVEKGPFVQLRQEMWQCDSTYILGLDLPAALQARHDASIHPFTRLFIHHREKSA